MGYLKYYLKYSIILTVLIVVLSSKLMAEPIGLGSNTAQNALPGTTVSITTKAENPLLPTKKATEPGDWLSQVSEIRQKYHSRRKHILRNFEASFRSLDAYGLLRLDRYGSKADLLDGFRKAELAFAAIHSYRSKNELNDQQFIEAFQHINAAPATRNKLIQMLTKNMNSPKEASQKRLILLEENLFSELLALYKLLASNATFWEIKAGAFIFKKDLMKERYKIKERRLNNAIRKLQSQRELENETS